jgi:hypothetical protein
MHTTRTRELIFKEVKFLQLDTIPKRLRNRTCSKQMLRHFTNRRAEVSDEYKQRIEGKELTCDLVTMEPKLFQLLTISNTLGHWAYPKRELIGVLNIWK